MELFILLSSIALGLLICAALKSMQRPKNYPPGPTFMPIVGNTLQLKSCAKAFGGQHLVYEQWSKAYKSRVLGLKLGSEFVIVALSYPLVHKIHLSEVFDGRPDNFFLRLRTMGTRKGITSTDGHLWAEHRNFATRQLRQVGYGRSTMDVHIAQEAHDLVRHIVEQVGQQPVWPATFLATSVINVLWTLTAGKRYAAEDKRLKRLLELMNRRSKAFDVSGGALAQFPWLRHFAPDRTGYTLVRELNTELYNFFMDIITEHKSAGAQARADSDFIYAYLHEMQNKDSKSESFNETQLVMTILDFFIAGSQTTSNTIDFALMMLTLRSEMQQQLFDEISENQKVEDAFSCAQLHERAAYPLMDAFIMEVQRYFHITPVTGPRRALADTELDGFRIPKNATILIDLRSVLMDKEHWGDPENFRPSRFLNENGLSRKDEYFMPFGQGRRRCLGDTLARACLFSFLVQIIANFRIESTDSNQLPDMQLLPGITLSAKPYKVKFIQRK